MTYEYDHFFEEVPEAALERIIESTGQVVRTYSTIGKYKIFFFEEFPIDLKSGPAQAFVAGDNKLYEGQYDFKVEKAAFGTRCSEKHWVRFMTELGECLVLSYRESVNDETAKEFRVELEGCTISYSDKECCIRGSIGYCRVYPMNYLLDDFWTKEEALYIVQHIKKLSPYFPVYFDYMKKVVDEISQNI